ncbi:MAG TPA: hypothetical protein VK578_00670 [Edaphobacter sp.]|nr:hypothetical protein [Edaphobacter sp.]
MRRSFSATDAPYQSALKGVDFRGPEAWEFSSSGRITGVQVCTRRAWREEAAHSVGAGTGIAVFAANVLSWLWGI